MICVFVQRAVREVKCHGNPWFSDGHDPSFREKANSVEGPCVGRHKHNEKQGLRSRGPGAMRYLGSVACSCSPARPGVTQEPIRTSRPKLFGGNFSVGGPSESQHQTFSPLDSVPTDDPGPSLSVWP